MLLCDFAQVRANLLTIVSAGITRLHRADLPGPANVCLAIVLELDPADIQRAHDLRLVIMGPDSEIGMIEGGIGVTAGADIEPGESLQVPVVFDLRGMPVHQYGSHSARLTVDGSITDTLEFWVVNTLPAGM